MRDDALYLQDIREAIARIERYSAQGNALFMQDELIQTWIVHHLQIIGEAARALSDTLRQQHPEIPWPQIIAMRNILVHTYFSIDRDVIWTTVEHDLPDLKSKVIAIMQTLGKNSQP